MNSKKYELIFINKYSDILKLDKSGFKFLDTYLIPFDGKLKHGIDGEISNYLSNVLVRKDSQYREFIQDNGTFNKETVADLYQLSSVATKRDDLIYTEVKAGLHAKEYCGHDRIDIKLFTSILMAGVICVLDKDFYLETLTNKDKDYLIKLNYLFNLGYKFIEDRIENGTRFYMFDDWRNLTDERITNIFGSKRTNKTCIIKRQEQGDIPYTLSMTRNNSMEHKIYFNSSSLKYSMTKLNYILEKLEYDEDIVTASITSAE